MSVQLDLLKRHWCEENRPRVLQVAGLLNRPFTTDDLHLTIEEPENPNWFGVLLAQMRNTGAIVEAGRVKSVRPSANGRKIGAWRKAV